MFFVIFYGDWHVREDIFPLAILSADHCGQFFLFFVVVFRVSLHSGTNCNQLPTTGRSRFTEGSHLGISALWEPFDHQLNNNDFIPN